MCQSVQWEDERKDRTTDDMVVVRLQRLRLLEEPFSLHNKEPFSPFHLIPKKK